MSGTDRPAQKLEPRHPLRVAALAKQIPQVEELRLDEQGRLVRDGIQLFMNDYCRRAVKKGIEISEASGGTLTVFTMGPPSANDVCREAIACGASTGVHLCDPAFAGSDSLATAKALAAALQSTGPYDLILCGRNAVDADTGQVPPELAEILDLPFVTGVRELTLDGDTLTVRLEHDDEWVDARVDLPAVISCAERLCEPCKVKNPEDWSATDSSRIKMLRASDLGIGPWGVNASRTTVGAVRTVDIHRDRVILAGDAPTMVASTLGVLARRAALTPDRQSRTSAAAVPVTGGDGPVVAVCIEPERDRMTSELLGGAAALAAELGGSVTAIGPGPLSDLGPRGADIVIELHGSRIEEDVAIEVATWADEELPWAILAPGTAWGREVASRVAARLEAGLVGDAVGLSARDGRLVADKPAFGGSLVAEIHASSAVQMATVRAGVLPRLKPRAALARVQHRAASKSSRLEILGRMREDGTEELASAQVVIGCGQGVHPEDYPLVEEFADRLGASLCATRKVTDSGWMPRSRQVGITGHSIAPRLYIAIGLSGKYNHTAGVSAAGTIVAINIDSNAPVFGYSDVGIVGDWREVLEQLVPAITSFLPVGRISQPAT